MALTLKFPYRYRVGILLYFLILIKAAFHLSNSQFGYARVVVGCDAMDRTRCVKKAHPDDYAPVAGKSATAASVVRSRKVKLSCR